MEIESCYRLTRRREFIGSMIAFGLFRKFYFPDQEKTVFDVSGYMMPEVDPNKENLVVGDLETLGAKSAVIINPSLNLVERLKQRKITVILRPYLRHNQFRIDILDKFMNYPWGLIWLPFVEPNLPERIGEKDVGTDECQVQAVEVVHDPEEFIVKHFIPAARRVLTREGDRILIPHTAPWTPNNEYDFAEVMYKTIKNYIPQIPLKSLGISINSYIREPGQNPWSRNMAMYELASSIFEEDLPLYISEAGLHQDAKSNFSETVVADETERLLRQPIPKPLINSLKNFNVWNLGYLAYTPLGYHNPHLCNRDQILGFDKAALRKVEGKTEAFRRIEKLAQKAVALQR